MKHYSYKQPKYCRWCQAPYYATKPHNHDGFCSARCRQAHHRAYQNYVMAVHLQEAGSSKPQITHKKPRLKG
jgi:endogenous inhibitor of DNA gyrase (YacG/DUF329 family)